MRLLLDSMRSLHFVVALAFKCAGIYRTTRKTNRNAAFPIAQRAIIQRDTLAHTRPKPDVTPHHPGQGKLPAECVNFAGGVFGCLGCLQFERSG